MRKSIFTFLHNYHHLSSTAVLMAMPFSASILLSQALLPSFTSSSLSSSSLLFTIYSRIQPLFAAARTCSETLYRNHTRSTPSSKISTESSSPTFGTRSLSSRPTQPSSLSSSSCSTRPTHLDSTRRTQSSSSLPLESFFTRLWLRMP